MTSNKFLLLLLHFVFSSSPLYGFFLYFVKLRQRSQNFFLQKNVHETKKPTKSSQEHT